MWTAILFIIKALFVIGILFYITLGLTAIVLAVSGKIFIKISSLLEMPYLVFSSVVYIYLYGWFGSYYNELTVVYNGKLKDWLIYSVCIISLALYFKFSKKSLQEERLEISSQYEGSTFERDESGHLNPQLFQNLIVVYGLRLYWVSIVAFVLFYFNPHLIQMFYGNVPIKVANWFM